MRLAAVHNWPQKYAKFLDQIRVRLGLGPSGIAALERRAVEIPDVYADVAEEEWHEIAEELGFRALAALPLETPTGVLGAVTFYFAAPNSLSPETRGLVRMVADQMAAIAEKARLIQDLQRANARLTESNVQLERQYNDVIEARRVKDQFLANISHELRTPLTAVIGYIALMQEGVVGEITDEQKETLDQVTASSEHLLALIGDLLTMDIVQDRIAVCNFDLTSSRRNQCMRRILAVFLIDQQRLPRTDFVRTRDALQVHKSVLNASVFTQREPRQGDTVAADVLILSYRFKCRNRSISVESNKTANPSRWTLRRSGLVHSRWYIVRLFFSTTEQKDNRYEQYK